MVNCYDAGEALRPNQWRLSPLFAHDASGLPPTILLYAGFGPSRDEAAAHALKHSHAGVPLQTLYISDMIHGFLTMDRTIPAVGVAVNRISQALDTLSSEKGFFSEMVLLFRDNRRPAGAAAGYRSKQRWA